MKRIITSHREDLATLFGLIAGICGVLKANGVGDLTLIGTIEGSAIVALGMVTNYGGRP